MNYLYLLYGLGGVLAVVLLWAYRFGLLSSIKVKRRVLERGEVLYYSTQGKMDSTVGEHYTAMDDLISQYPFVLRAYRARG